MPSPDRLVSPPSLEPTRSPEAKDQIKREILKDLTGIVKLYEAFYLEPKEVEAAKGSLLTKARYKKFEEWLGVVFEKKMLPDSTIDESDLKNNAYFAVQLYEALQHLALGQSLHPEIKRSYDLLTLASDEFLLHREDIPSWNELPSEEEIKRDFWFGWIWKTEYRQGRKLKDPADISHTTKETLKDRKGFEPTDQDLCDILYAKNNPERRNAFLRNIDRADSFETLPPAKIFDITQVITKKREQDPDHPMDLTTQELLEAFDEANVRPGSLSELLAYSRKYWRPEVGIIHSSEDKERLQGSYHPYIYAFGSIFSDSMDTNRRNIAFLRWDENVRQLDGCSLNHVWDSADHFLVFRKR